MKIRKQNGLTLIGFLLVLALGLFFAYTAMRVIPMYLEYHALGNALETVRKDPNAADMTAGQIRNKIINSLSTAHFMMPLGISFLDTLNHLTGLGD